MPNLSPTHHSQSVPHPEEAQKLKPDPGFYGMLFKKIWLFWRSQEKKKAWFFCSISTMLALFGVLLGVWFNIFYGDLYTALQTYDQAAFFGLMRTFTLIAFLSIVVAVTENYCSERLKIAWRCFLTQHYSHFWLSEKRFYWMELTKTKSDNPDQRLSEDVHNIIVKSWTLFIDCFRAVVTLAVFLGLLWQLSGIIHFSAWGYNVTIPGYLVWITFIYALFGTWIAKKITTPLLPIDYQLERREGDLRFTLARIREHSDTIAAYSGSFAEEKRIVHRLQSLALTMKTLIRRSIPVNLWGSFYAQMAIIMPFLILSPRFFKEHLALGILMRVVQCFGTVLSAFSIIEKSYPLIISLKASALRLLAFEKNALEATKDQPQITAQPTTGSHFVLENLTLKTPGGKDIIHIPAKTLQTGKSVWIQGASGLGKSTLLRALYGIWPFGSGLLKRPKGTLFFLPQKPYIPLGTLKETLLYPFSPQKLEALECQEIFQAVGLSALLDGLPASFTWDTEQPWMHILSGGEVQRLGFARLLLAKPKWAFLDEATSALDLASETKLYTLLRKRLPNTTIISTGHRPSLATFHEEIWDVSPDCQS